MESPGAGSSRTRAKVLRRSLGTRALRNLEQHDLVEPFGGD